MTHEAMNAAAVLVLAGAVAWFWTLLDLMNHDGRDGGCRRRGCRPEAGWQGCDHARDGHGSAARDFTHEEG
ncbi:MAG: hypothetical protein EBR23_04100 [Planctomycetia bacterium]|nr:hypothetical protein [Planctomycetia bacterium]